jgi:hypothetical protein
MADEISKIVFDYDMAADVMHVTFGTGEPSFSEEIDDRVVADWGVYTGAPTGLQILSVKEAGVDPKELVKYIIQHVLPILEARKKEMQKAVTSERDQMLKNAMDRLQSEIKELVPA